MHPSDPARIGGEIETDLLGFTDRIARTAYEWRALFLPLSRLRPPDRRRQLLRFAISEFHPVLRELRSELFQLGSGDLVFLWSGAGTELVEPLVARLGYLLSDEVFVAAAEAGPGPVADGGAEGERPARHLCQWFDLERDHDLFRELVLSLLDAAGAQGGRAAAERPLDPIALARLEAHLAAADVTDLIRRQAVCAVLPDTPPQPLFHELHLAIGELARREAPGVDLAGDVWLFQRLKETLDQRLLAALMHAGAGAVGAAEGAISLNLRVSSLLSPAFLTFDREMRSARAAPVVIELQISDLITELGTFGFMRDFLRERGYRVCIDGVHAPHLPLLDRRRLGADLVKLVWGEELALYGTRRPEDLQAFVKRTGVDRLILCRCDSGSAVTWGQAMGIRLFQGFHLDSRLRAIRSPVIKAARAALRGGTRAG